MKSLAGPVYAALNHRRSKFQPARERETHPKCPNFSPLLSAGGVAVQNLCIYGCCSFSIINDCVRTRFALCEGE